MRCVCDGQRMTRDNDSDILFDNPFSNLEDAHLYVRLLTEALDEARETIQEDLAATRNLEGAERRVDALLVVDLKLRQLRGHFQASRTLLNDLRTLRRLIFGERDEPTSDLVPAPAPARTPSKLSSSL